MIKAADWQYALIFSLCLLLLFSLIIFLKTDLYIRNYIFENGIHKFEYQKNFFKNKVRTFSIDSKSIYSYKFSANINSDSSSNQNTFNSIYLKYTDDDGDIDDKTFKFNNVDLFLKLIIELQKMQKENTTE